MTANPLAYETIEGKRYLRFTDEWRAARYTASRHECERRAIRAKLQQTAELLVAKNPAFFTHHALACLGEINQALNPSGMTLLHLAARLYSLAMQRYDRKGAQYYAAVTKCLLAAGANPFNLMQRWSQYDEEGRCGSSLDTPAAVCDGNMPPALRERMTAEAAAGRIPAYTREGSRTESMVRESWARSRRVHAKRTPPKESPRAQHCLRPVTGVDDAGTAWIARLPSGEVVATVPYDSASRASICVAHSKAATALRSERCKLRKRAMRQQAKHRKEVAVNRKQREVLRQQLAMAA